MARPKKFTEFRKIRWLKLGLNEERAADILGVTVSQVKAWDYEEPPIMASRLLQAYDRKSVGHEGWDGWYFSRGALHYKNMQWRPQSLLHSRFDDSRLRDLDSECRRIFAGLGFTEYQAPINRPGKTVVKTPVEKKKGGTRLRGVPAFLRLKGVS
jgi:hypothetical protein